MVRIAIAGGSGNVAREVVDVLVATTKHEILLLSRKDVSTDEAISGVTWVKTNYEDPEHLVQILKGVHTLLSFVITQEDPTSTVQKNLINAAVQAGVKRFAPSEWATSDLESMSWYAYKVETRRYLKELNKDKKVLEYTLFQPGIFLNYFTAPYKSSKHVHELEVPFDFANCRALVVDGSDDSRITLTTVQDLANVVARAIDFEGEWPAVGGIRGTDISVGGLIALGEKVRGKSFDIKKLKARDLETDTWESSWIPKADHPSIPPEQVDVMSRVIVAGFLLAVSAESCHVSDEWNQLLPDYRFTRAEEFLHKVWHDKP